MHTGRLLSKYPIISDQIELNELKILLTCLESLLARGKHDAVVEFGCFEGTSSLFIQRLINAYGTGNEFHVYDSFEGLPGKTGHDESPAGLQFMPGELKASKRQLISNFKRSNLQLPYIHKGWFDSLSPHDIPEPICFAFLDGDYYQSILTPLRLIESKVSSGAYIIVDDYQSESLPGAKKAVDLWANEKGYALTIAHSLAVIRIP